MDTTPVTLDFSTALPIASYELSVVDGQDSALAGAGYDGVPQDPGVYPVSGQQQTGTAPVASVGDEKGKRTATHAAQGDPRFFAPASPITLGGITGHNSVGQNSNASTLGMSLFYAAQQDPDQYARLLHLQDVTGIPPIVGAGNETEIQQWVDANSIDPRYFTTIAPVTAAWASNPGNAAVAGVNEIQRIGNIEQNAAAMRVIQASSRNPLPNFPNSTNSTQQSGDDNAAMHFMQASSRNPLPNFPNSTASGQPPDGDAQTAAQSKARQNVANQAAHLNGNTGYLYSRSNGSYPANTNKCNEFVADTISASGIPRPQVPKSGIRGRLGITRDPTAKEWATMPIPGWSAPDSVANARPGDVIAVGHHDDPEGHVGIVVAPGQTASANALTHPPGIVTINNWGFRPSGQNEEHSGDRVVVRHYIGVHE